LFFEIENLRLCSFAEAEILLQLFLNLIKKCMLQSFVDHHKNYFMCSKNCNCYSPSFHARWPYS